MKKSGITGVTLLAALLLAGCANKNEGTSFSKQYDEAAKNRLKRYKLSIDGSTYTPGRGDNTEESVQIWVSAKKGDRIKLVDKESSEVLYRETVSDSISDGQVMFWVDADSSPTIGLLTVKGKHKIGSATIHISPTKDSESSDSSAITESESSSSSKTSDESTQTSKSKAPETNSSETNLVYGAFSKSKMSDYLDDLHKTAGSAYQGSSGSMKVTLGVTGKTINVVEMNFADAPMDTDLDKDHINDLITQWMGSDVKLTSSVSNNEYIYTSTKLNRTYRVRYQRNSNNEVTEIHIYRTDQ